MSQRALATDSKQRAAALFLSEAERANGGGGRTQQVYSFTDTSDSTDSGEKMASYRKRRSKRPTAKAMTPKASSLTNVVEYTIDVPRARSTDTHLPVASIAHAHERSRAPKPLRSSGDDDSPAYDDDHVTAPFNSPEDASKQAPIIVARTPAKSSSLSRRSSLSSTRSGSLKSQLVSPSTGRTFTSVSSLTSSQASHPLSAASGSTVGCRYYDKLAVMYHAFDTDFEENATSLCSSLDLVSTKHSGHINKLIRGVELR